ncbi:MAG: HEAT repeat domain-containing protein [Candidatus Riflebacteria bacterium]|nr:HEAT repeat domain-containing protein [Candidatus Riflebacteria bacterium]
MLVLEMKIFILTGVYFAGWFFFETVFSFIRNRFFASHEDTSDRGSPRSRAALAQAALATAKAASAISAGDVTPLDQTTRYLKGLKSSDWRVRRISCIQLSDTTSHDNTRETAIVQGLIDALCDSREEVSLAAGESLAKIGNPMAIAALTNHVQTLELNMDESYERSRAA